MESPVNFKVSGSSEFFVVLRKKVDDYFVRKRLERSANGLALLKMVFFLSLFIGSYLVLMFADLNGWLRYICALICGLTSVLLIFNIAHDCSHGAFFKSRRLNKAFSYLFNLVGANAYSWHLTHNMIHHNNPNVTDFDADIHRSAPVIRLSPTVKWRPTYRYQHIYAPILYLFNTIFFLFLKDFQDLRVIPKKNQVKSLDLKHPWKQYLVLFISKAFYLCYALFLPMMILDIPSWQVLLLFISIQMAMSILVSYVLITPHLEENVHFLVPDRSKNVDWVEHIMATTVDFSIYKNYANFFFGALNTHVIHHLFPGICHVHYYSLNKLLVETAREMNMNYRHQSGRHAVLNHFKLLKKMGRKPFNNKK